MKILSDNEIDVKQWEMLLELSPTASFFQTKECYDFYQEQSFFDAFLLGVTENDKLVGLCCGYIIANGGAIKRYFSQRAIIPGGLLLDAEISDEAISSLLKAVKEALGRKAIYIEIRNYKDYSFAREEIEKSGFAYQAHLNIHVPTNDKEKAFRNLSASKRRQLKLNKKSGLLCTESKDLSDLKAFYEILSEVYRNKARRPLFPFSFFENLLQKSFTRFFVVKKDNRVLGGIICVELTGKVVYEWFVCGNDKLERGIYPSLAATWKAIEYAAENGFAYFDFLGAGKPDEAYGVREFKSKFGGELVEHGRFINIKNPLRFRVGRLIMSVMSIRIF